jgi:transketolase
METAVTATDTDLDQLCVNTIRGLCMDAIQKANSGHPGTPVGIAPVAYTLWQRFLRFDPTDPIWPNRDRFVLSEGHASALRCSTSRGCGRSIRTTRCSAGRRCPWRT